MKANSKESEYFELIDVCCMFHVFSKLRRGFSFSKPTQAKTYVEFSTEYLEKEFGISVHSEMVKVEGRVLPAPHLSLGPQDEVLTPQKGGWDLRGKHLHSAARLSVWTVACFALEPNQYSDGLLRKFFKALTNMSCREGMQMAQPVDWRYFESRHEVIGFLGAVLDTVEVSF